MQGFGKKYRKPSGARMIFSTNPKGLALLVREEHELPLPVVMGTRLRYARFSRCVICVRLRPVYVAFSKKITVLGAKKSEFLRFELSHNALNRKPRK